MTAPYAEAAAEYLQLGWSPLPLPRGRKKPPPAGWTGYAGAYPTPDDVARWARTRAAGNLALRLPETVLGIDVDAYHDGAATLADAEVRLGLLPPTWSSTSRSDGSCIAFYRVPAARCWADALPGGGVELIHHGHRYAVVWPSTNPNNDGAQYRWFDPAGQLAATVSPVDDLPGLPPLWVEELDRGDAGDRAAKADLEDSDVAAWLNDLPGGDDAPCPRLARYVASLRDELAETAGSRHDATRNAVLRVVGAGDQHHRGIRAALAECERLLAAQRPLSDPGEIARMVAGAVAICTADPAEPFERGCFCHLASEESDTDV